MYLEKKTWLVVVPMFNAVSEEAFACDYIVGPCTEADLIEFVYVRNRDERLLLSVLREFGWDEELAEINEDTSAPLTDSGYIPGMTYFVDITDLASSRGLSTVTGKLAA